MVINATFNTSHTVTQAGCQGLDMGHVDGIEEGDQKEPTQPHLALMRRCSWDLCELPFLGEHEKQRLTKKRTMMPLEEVFFLGIGLSQKILAEREFWCETGELAVACRKGCGCRIISSSSSQGLTPSLQR